MLRLHASRIVHPGEPRRRRAFGPEQSGQGEEQGIAHRQRDTKKASAYFALAELVGGQTARRLSAVIARRFLDITNDPDMKVPTQPERCEKLLQEAVRKAKKPIVLFINVTHDLHGYLLNGLKRLHKGLDAGDGTLSAVLVGYPGHQSDLRRAIMEEISHRTIKFEFNSVGNERREFIAWLLTQCLSDGIKPAEILEETAQEYLADRLSTLLQFAEHLNRAFTDTYRMVVDYVTRYIVAKSPLALMACTPSYQDFRIKSQVR